MVSWPVAGTWRTKALDVLAVATLVAVPLAWAPGLADPFTTAKWYVLHVAAIAGAVLFALEGVAVPGFVRRHPVLLATLGGLALASALRTGLARGVSPLLDRFAMVAAVLMLFTHLRRRRADLGAVSGAVAVAVLATVGGVLVERAGLDPFRGLAAGDGRSASFGNVNIAAQFLALSLPSLLWAAVRARGRGRRLGLHLLVAGALASIALLGGRSAALAAALVLLVWIGRRAVPAVAVGAVLGGALVLAGALLWRSENAPFASETIANKAAATSIRLGLWEGTARLIRDHPLGVGAANFPDRFVPYQAGALPPDEGLLYRWPHDEWLRVAAEEGLPFAALALAAVVLLVRETRRALRRQGRPPEDGAFLLSLSAAVAVEATFQFPFAMAAGALATALLAAFALSVAEGRPEPEPIARRGPRPSAGWALAACACAVAFLRIAGADYMLGRPPRRRAALEAACALDPRRADVCVRAAWRQLRAGDRARGRATLDRVLAASPYYYPALKMRAQDALRAGEREEACRSLALYDGLFAAASSVHATLSAHCPPARSELSLGGGGTAAPPDGS